jgi:hypothetical protein
MASMSSLLPAVTAAVLAVAALVPALASVSSELVMGAGGLVSWAACASLAPASFSLSRFSLMGIFLGAYSLMIALPSLYIRWAIPDVGGAWFYPGVILVLPLSCVGWWVSAHLLGHSSERFAQYAEARAQVTPGRAPMVCWTGLVGLCLALALIHLVVSPVNPLQVLLGGGSTEELAMAREASFKTLPIPGIKYLFSWLLSVLFPFAVLWAYGRALLDRTMFWRLTTVAATATALLYATFTIAKAPAAMLVGMMFVVSFVVRGRKVPVVGMIAGGLLVLLIPAILVAAISDAGPVDVAVGIGKRLFYVPAEALVFYFEAFDVEHAFLQGRSINLVSRLVDGSAPFPVANYIFHLIHPQGLKTGLSNAAFVGTMWANFSVIGLFVGPILAGALIGLSEWLVCRGPKTLLKVCLHGVLCLQVFFLSSRSITVAMLTGGWVPALMLVFFAGYVFAKWGEREHQEGISNRS